MAEGRGLRQLFLWARSRPSRGTWAPPPATSHPGRPSGRQFPHPSARRDRLVATRGHCVLTPCARLMQRTDPWWTEPQLPWASVSLPYVSSSPTPCAETGGEGPLCESCFPGRSWGLFGAGSSPGTSDGSPLPPSRVQLGQGGRLTRQQSRVQIPLSPPRPWGGGNFVIPFYTCARGLVGGKGQTTAGFLLQPKPCCCSALVHKPPQPLPQR